MTVYTAKKGRKSCCLINIDVTNGNEVEIIMVILIQLVSFEIQNFISCNQECQVNVAAVLYVDIIIHCTSKLIEQMNM